MKIEVQMKQYIENALKEIERDYKAVKGLILTESDLKCLIYSKLMTLRVFSTPEITMESNILSHSLHTELSWYDESGRLAIVPDITILQPRHLSIVRGLGDTVLPNKQYSFGGSSIIFELKFIKERYGITRKVFFKEILHDFRKINRLFYRLERDGMRNDVFCYFIIFNKTNKVCEEFEDFLTKYKESERHMYIYVTGNVDLDDINNNRFPNKYLHLMRYSKIPPFNMVQRKKGYLSNSEEDTDIL